MGEATTPRDNRDRIGAAFLLAPFAPVEHAPSFLFLEAPAQARPAWYLDSPILYAKGRLG